MSLSIDIDEVDKVFGALAEMLPRGTVSGYPTRNGEIVTVKE
jgi:hypothetical protein